MISFTIGKLATRMNAHKTRKDFYEIARLVDNGPSGSDRFDRFLISLIPADANNVLDVGCGLGRLSAQVALKGKSVLGLDFSSEMITKARLFAADSPGVAFRCCDFLAADFEAESFDCVISAATIHHLPLAETIKKMIALVKPGGCLIIHDLRSDSGIFDMIRSRVALVRDALGRFVKTGSLRSPKEVRDAWSRHAEGETYLTMAQVEAVAAGYLPDALVFYHWLWRYTIFWSKPSVNNL